MKRYMKLIALLPLITCLLMATKCKISNKENIEFGMKIPTTFKLKEKGDILTSSSSFEKAYFLKNNEINYLICKDSENRITYISTDDTNFITEEGIRLGMSINDPLITTKNEIFMEPGYAYILPLKSGWFAEFSISDYDSGIMSPDSTIKLFFKRRGLVR